MGELETLLLMLVIYFLPTILAINRGIEPKGGVFVVNLFLGWTFLGWVGALAWAVSAKSYSVKNKVFSP